MSEGRGTFIGPPPDSHTLPVKPPLGLRVRGFIFAKMNPD